MEKHIESLEDIERFYRKGEEWLKKSHEDGLSGMEFVQSRSSLLDSVIRRLFRRVVGDQGKQTAPSGFALLAVGGYGREEINPYSDIDLLLLHPPGKEKGLEDWLRRFLHPLWDWGLTVGYTVQTSKDCWRTAEKDLELFLSLLEGRFLAGERETFLQWEEELPSAFPEERKRKFVLQIQEREESRHAHGGGSVFVLEPEVKEGKGGLRDYHAALGAARIKFSIRSAKELTEKGLLSEREWGQYSLALGFLWRVRNQLHYLHGRREDRLSFEDQEAVAQALHYHGENSQAATESFLKEYFSHALQVYHISTNVMEKCLDERLLLPLGESPDTPLDVAPGFAVYHGKLIPTESGIFQRNPFQLWTPFAMVHQHGLRMDARLKESIAEALDLVTERFRLASQSIHSFRSFFEKPGHLDRVVEAMHETGFLRQFLPEFQRVYCHIQYDRYHIYPVDVHSFYTLRELEDLTQNGPDIPSPILKELIRELKDPGILRFAALLHDLGKGEGPSHVLRGEKIARVIGRRLQLAPERIEVLCFLVREHLTFVEIAHRRDLSDENLIFRFAQTIGDSERLKMLYLLCYADLRAVGPSSWTAWKDTLMRELFLKTLHLLEKGEGLEKEAQDHRVQVQKEVMDFLFGQMPAPKVSEYLVQIPSRHYAVYDSRSIAQQILMAERLTGEAVILEGEKRAEEGWDEIVVVARDTPGLFAKISGVMTANQLNILSAQISTWENGVAVDLFWVENMIEDDLFQPRRWNKLQDDMRRILTGETQVQSLMSGLAFPLFHPYATSRRGTRVEVDNEASDFYTLIEIFTHDRPGLLYAITRKIFELGFNIASARISTKVDQVVDVFYVQDMSGAKLEDETLIAQIKKELAEELSKQ